MAEWKVFALASAFFAGLTAVLAKTGLQNIPSGFATFIRTIVILIFLFLIVTAKNEWQSFSSLNKHSLLFLILSGIATGLSWLCYFKALQAGPASLVAPIDKLSIVFAVFLSIIFLGESLCLAQWIGIALITSGAIIIICK